MLLIEKNYPFDLIACINLASSINDFQIEKNCMASEWICMKLKDEEIHQNISIHAFYVSLIKFEKRTFHHGTIAIRNCTLSIAFHINYSNQTNDNVKYKCSIRIFDRLSPWFSETFKIFLRFVVVVAFCSSFSIVFILIFVVGFFSIYQ